MPQRGGFAADAQVRVANGIPFSPLAEFPKPGADGQVVELERGVGDEERQRECAAADLSRFPNRSGLSRAFRQRRA